MDNHPGVAMMKFSPQGQALMMLVVGMMISVALCIGYTVKVHDDDNKLWCELLPILDRPVPTPSVTPAPLTEREKSIAAAVHNITISKCGRSK